MKLALLGLLTLLALQDKKPAPVTDPDQAGPDYKIQGEYEGDKWGAQVVALGGDAFDVRNEAGGDLAALRDGEPPRIVPAAALENPDDTLSPAVRRLVRHYDLDITGIHGTGPSGRIRVGDVIGMLGSRADGTPPTPGRAQARHRTATTRSSRPVQVLPIEAPARSARRSAPLPPRRMRRRRPSTNAI